MLFYTNILAKGNNVFFRGFKDGKRVSQKIDFKPSLYVKSNSKNTQYKSMWGEPLEKLNFDTISEARNFIKQYKDVENFHIFGNFNYGYQFINKVFPNTIDFDTSLLKIVTIDIETTTEFGFPDPRSAQEEIILITLQDIKIGRAHV